MSRVTSVQGDASSVVVVLWLCFMSSCDSKLPLCLSEQFQGFAWSVSRLTSRCMYACRQEWLHCLPVCLHACLRVWLSACMHACLDPCLPACLPASLHASMMHAYPHACMLADLHAAFHACITCMQNVFMHVCFFSPQLLHANLLACCMHVTIAQ